MSGFWADEEISGYGRRIDLGLRLGVVSDYGLSDLLGETGSSEPFAGFLCTVVMTALIGEWFGLASIRVAGKQYRIRATCFGRPALCGPSAFYEAILPRGSTSCRSSWL